MPALTIVATTYITTEARKKRVEEVIESWAKYLKYNNNIFLHIADDGSTLSIDYQKLWPSSLLSYSRQERHGVGASLNKGFQQAFWWSPLVAYFVDDWELTEPLDVTPWCQALMENETMGIMRLGPPSPFMRGTIEIVTANWQGWALKCDNYGLVVGHRPEIFHKRWTDRYGHWEEDINACEVERRATVKWAEDPDRLGIYLALPHKFFHNDTTVPSLSEMEPH